jgi:ubiquinone/menaquinone biosynthesis C-methylase UbiE
MDDSLFSEAEIQALIALLELAQPRETPNNNFYAFYPKTLEEAATYFRKYRVDWTAAYPSLVAKGLLVHWDSLYHLTEAGCAQAEQIRAARPPIWYWYKEFFTEAPRSPTYARFCEALYGKYLCQAGFSDMTQLDAMLHALGLGEHSRALDLGCGIGMVAEYFSDVSGAHFSGMDYIPDAIAQAQERTAAKRQRLSFQVGNLDNLPFPPGSFDALISIDTLYMPNNLDSTLAQMRRLLTPGGRMAVFYTHMLWEPGSPRESLQADKTPLGQALGRAGLALDAQDFSAETYVLLHRKRQIAEAMRADFAAEGRSFLYDHLVTESESSPAPFDPQTSNMSRYLYIVQT